MCEHLPGLRADSYVVKKQGFSPSNQLRMPGIRKRFRDSVCHETMSKTRDSKLETKGRNIGEIPKILELIDYDRSLYG
jgi:hypothetical protein